MEMQFKLMFPNNTTIIKIPESPMFNVAEADSVTKPFLEIVHQSGREYAANGEISSATLEKLSVPMIPEDMYAKIANGET